MKLRVTYNAHAGHVIEDGKAKQWVDKIISEALNLKEPSHYMTITVASDLLIHFFRLRLGQGVLKVDQIEFVFDGKTLEHNEYGRITHWPKGFCDIPIEPVEQLLTLAAKKRKK